MSRGHGKVERFVLDRLSDPVPAGQWPPWVTVEALAAWYVGLDSVTEVVMTQDDDGVWRELRFSTAADPTAQSHLVGLSVEYGADLRGGQHLSRSAVEAVRRAVKNLAASGRIDVDHIESAGRGRAWGNVARAWMLSGRRLLTDVEAEIDAERNEVRMAKARAIMAMMR